MVQMHSCLNNNYMDLSLLELKHIYSFSVDLFTHPIVCSVDLSVHY